MELKEAAKLSLPTPLKSCRTYLMSFNHAIVRPPGANFAQGLTSAGLGPPDLAKALAQHQAYCQALEKCGLAVTILSTDESLPDSTFVEDTAIITARGALLTRPGAVSRLGEVAAIRPALERHFPDLANIQPPGTLDGGDVCEANDQFFIGISHRTNEDGAWQLARWLEQLSYVPTVVDIRRRPGLLHLKSGVAWLGGNRIAVVEELAGEAAFRDYEILLVAADESYAANCLGINDTLLIAQGFPRFAAAARQIGGKVVALDVSEFRKMDGGLSCLSLRW